MLKLMSLIIVLFAFSCKEQHFEKESLFKRLNVLAFKKNLIQMNILNVNTTRTIDGGAYKPLVVELCSDGFCKSRSVENPILKYDPKHPDANTEGYVAYPNIDLDLEKLKLEKVRETIDLVLKKSSVNIEYFVSSEGKEYLKKYKMVKTLFDLEGLD